MTTSPLLVAVLAGGFSLLGVAVGYLFRVLEAHTQRKKQFEWEAQQRKFQASIERDRHLFDARRDSYIDFRSVVGATREELRRAARMSDTAAATRARNNLWEAFGPIQLLGGVAVREAALAILRKTDSSCIDLESYDEEDFVGLALDFMDAARKELVELAELPSLPAH